MATCRYQARPSHSSCVQQAAARRRRQGTNWEGTNTEAWRGRLGADSPHRGRQGRMSITTAPAPDLARGRPMVVRHIARGALSPWMPSVPVYPPTHLGDPLHAPRRGPKTDRHNSEATSSSHPVNPGALHAMCTSLHLTPPPPPYYYPCGPSKGQYDSAGGPELAKKTNHSAA